MSTAFDRLRWRALAAIAAAALAAVAPAGAAVPPPGIPPLPPAYTDWPLVRSPVPLDPAQEARIADIVAGMTLEQKVGQMTQADAHVIGPADVRKYYVGSVLSGGDGWPDGDRHASPSAWLAMADALWEASMTTDAAVKIPILWGIDAVHGHGRIYGATLFPHHIGLGAMHDPALVRRIGAATAEQLRTTGHDWTFSPCVAVPRDDRWGRTYEGFSEDPAITRSYAQEMVAGLQELGPVPDPLRPHGVVATAKHFIGDGGTDRGIDQGVNRSTEAELLNLHGQGYLGALGAGVQSVMVSYGSWLPPDQGPATPATVAEARLHGSRHLVTDVLKGKMGFDGLVVSDWKGAGSVPGCTATRCARAIEAGVDVFMVADEWRGFIRDTLDLVRKGEVSEGRIDDAVRRILRVKLRMGLFDMPRPSERPFARDASRLVHHELAAEAVRESLVLLKNERHALPLDRRSRVLVVGKSADSLSNQTGGWSIDWQGNDTGNADFPAGSTVLAGIRRAVGDGNVTFSERAKGVDLSRFDAVVAVLGETPYSEFKGDLSVGLREDAPRTLEHARLHPEDLAVLKRVSGRGKPVVTVFLSGRPLLTNRELNRSDAFVAAWLPGTEGAAIAEVLFRGEDGKPARDFTGKLPFSWPLVDCLPVNAGDAGTHPLFPYGYGLSYAGPGKVAQLPEPAGRACE